MSDETLAVEVRDLTRRFGAFVAVDHISFSVTRGEIFGFLGPNGAGKSTTIRMLCGILEPTSGAGTVAGYDIFCQSEQVKRNIGYMSQRFSLYPDLKARENLEFYAGVYGVPRRERGERILQVARQTGVEERLGDPTAVLTGGWRQRLALACALVHRPPIVFLDEPTSGVDPLSRRAFWDIIQDLAHQGITVFVTTHYLEEAEYCQRLVLINNGHIVLMGSPRQMKATFPHPILSIQCSPMVKALSLLQDQSSQGDLSVWVDSLHVVLKEEETRQRILDILNAGGVTVGREERVAPSLEDVFVLKTGEERAKDTA